MYIAPKEPDCGVLVKHIRKVLEKRVAKVQGGMVNLNRT